MPVNNGGATDKGDSKMDLGRFVTREFDRIKPQSLDSRARFARRRRVYGAVAHENSAPMIREKHEDRKRGNDHELQS